MENTICHNETESFHSYQVDFFRHLPAPDEEGPGLIVGGCQTAREALETAEAIIEKDGGIYMDDDNGGLYVCREVPTAYIRVLPIVPTPFTSARSEVERTIERGAKAAAPNGKQPTGHLLPSS